MCALNHDVCIEASIVEQLAIGIDRVAARGLHLTAAMFQMTVIQLHEPSIPSSHARLLCRRPRGWSRRTCSVPINDVRHLDILARATYHTATQDLRPPNLQSRSRPIAGPATEITRLVASAGPLQETSRWAARRSEGGGVGNGQWRPGSSDKCMESKVEAFSSWKSADGGVDVGVQRAPGILLVALQNSSTSSGSLVAQSQIYRDSSCSTSPCTVSSSKESVARLLGRDIDTLTPGPTAGHQAIIWLGQYPATQCLGPMARLRSLGTTGVVVTRKPKISSSNLTSRTP